MSVVRTPATVDHCRSFLAFLTGSVSAFVFVIIDSLAPDTTRELTSQVLDCNYFLPAVMNSLTNIIGLKWTCTFYWLDFSEYLIGKHSVMLHLSYWT